MPKRPSHTSESERTKTTSGERRVRADDAIRASVQLASTMVGGAAAAVADGFQAFDDELSPQNVRDRGFLNGLIDGMIAGQTRFLRSLAENGDRVQENFRDLESEVRPERVAEPIDYDRLARAVAAEMRRQDATPYASDEKAST